MLHMMIFIQVEIEITDGLKNIDQKSADNTVIEEPARKNKQKSRGKREAITGSASNFRLFGALAMILGVIALLGVRRGAQQITRNFL